jgi:cytoskeletal protein CcmA (bactofilin family)
MFKGKKKIINPNTTDTIIGEGSSFEGRIKSSASLRVEGNLTGDIDCMGDVTVGENGHVRSNISARDVIIAGHVHGNIITKGKLTITATGELHGNITAQSFIIAEGGVFQGSSKMEHKQQAAGGNHPNDNDTPGKSFNSGNGSGSGYSNNSIAL